MTQLARWMIHQPCCQGGAVRDRSEPQRRTATALCNDLGGRISQQLPDADRHVVADFPRDDGFAKMPPCEISVEWKTPLDPSPVAISRVAAIS